MVGGKILTMNTPEWPLVKRRLTETAEQKAEVSMCAAQESIVN